MEATRFRMALQMAARLRIALQMTARHKTALQKMAKMSSSRSETVGIVEKTGMQMETITKKKVKEEPLRFKQLDDTLLYKHQHKNNTYNLELS